METRRYEIDETLAGTRVDKTLTDLLECSRKRVKDLIDEEHVLVNGKSPKASQKVQLGDILEIEIPPMDELEVNPEDIPLDIVYEDSDIIVINKPKGMVVHPAPGHYSGTLVNALLFHCTDLSGINGIIRPGIVHRIDKDTSGLLVVAKNDEAHASLSEQLSNKTCKREYLAIVHHPFSHDHGTINAPIGRDSKDRQKMTVTAQNSKEAVTHFQVIENFAQFSYIKCQLETGRTHQIRVHMAYIEHPIAGDPKYAYRKTIPTKNGQLLHAHKLEFVHPRTKENMSFTVEMEEEFASVLKQLQEGLL
ncbi:MAG: RluA family pseudouridine synthase [Firmicutes bacterium]|nr:RluA family pseudouridine synthase [Bacillota bacterium]